MSRFSHLLTVAGLLCLGLWSATCTPPPPAPVWPETASVTKPWTRWWWMGNAVDSSELRRHLVAYAQAGIGGVEITPIYGVRGEEDRFIDFLSPAWVARLRYTLRIADSLGLGVDMNTGTGWPFGGPQVPDSLAAGKYHLQAYPVQAGQRFVARLVPPDTVAGEVVHLARLMLCGPDGPCQDYTAAVSAGRTVDLAVPPGFTQAYALFAGQTRQRVKRAAPGGEGLVMDHFSRAALDTYLARFDTALGTGPGPVRAFFNDSYEVYGTNWTTGFLDTFRQRRGYALEAYLPALAGQADSLTIRRVRQDYFMTLGDLVYESFTQPWAAWAQARQALVRNQAHGSPGNWLDLYAAVDIPECETFGASPFPDLPGLRREARHVAPDQPNFFAHKMATSAAHLSGKRLASAESCTWLADHFRVSLSQMKPELDQLFLAGVNHLFFHGSTYSPADAPWPGWLFYASTHVDPVNPSWDHLPATTAYLTRCQSVLQAGEPATQLLLYWPYADLLDQLTLDGPLIGIHNIETWLLPTGFYALAQELDRLGYQVDFVSDRQLAEAQVRDGQLYLGGRPFAALLLPPLDHLPHETLAHSLAHARAGVPVVLPADFAPLVPGQGDAAARQARLDSLLQAVAGTVLRAQPGQYETVLTQVGLYPEPAVAQGLRLIKRILPDGACYFLAHLGGPAVQGWVPFREEMAQAVVMNPLDGRYGTAPLRSGTLPEVFLALAPGESIILRTYRKPRRGLPAWSWPAATDTRLALTGPWSLRFLTGGPSLPPDTLLPQPAYWTQLPGAAYGRFAGRAAYETTLVVDQPDRYPHWILRLDSLAESATVYVNGETAGTVWSLPFRLDIGPWLRPGANALRIEVANLMANRIAWMDQSGIPWRRFYDINLVDVHYQPFDASGWAPMPSGLGPVQVTGHATVRPD